MITLAAVAALIAAYLWYGLARVAPNYVTRAVQKDAEEYPSLAEDPAYVARERRTRAVEAVAVALIWPAYFAGRALVEGIAGRSPLSPHELQQRIDERDRRIAELERELRANPDA